MDHLWIRVADVPASRRFYEVAAPFAGLRVAEARDDYVRFAGPTGSFSLLAGPPTEHLHMAFPRPRRDVEAFHRAAVAAGYRDNGPPASVRSTTPATSAPTFSTPTATTSSS